MRYKEVLEKYGITQIELAEKLGINRVSVSRLLSEKNDMRTSTLIKIANAIGCHVGELFDDNVNNAGSSTNTFVCNKCGAKYKIVEEQE